MTYIHGHGHVFKTYTHLSTICFFQNSSYHSLVIHNINLYCYQSQISVSIYCHVFHFCPPTQLSNYLDSTFMFFFTISYPSTYCMFLFSDVLTRNVNCFSISVLLIVSGTTHNICFYHL